MATHSEEALTVATADAVTLALTSRSSRMRCEHDDVAVKTF